ncbi:BrnT family toxin [Rhodanobacter lindaniclasticus]
MEISFDPAKADANLKKHGVSFAHAEQALRDVRGLTVDDPDAVGEWRQVTLGMDALGVGRLVVVHTQRGEWTRIISARKASRGETGSYHA